jgi:hypothetical protein
MSRVARLASALLVVATLSSCTSSLQADSPSGNSTITKTCGGSIAWTVTSVAGDKSQHDLGTSLTLQVGDTVMLTSLPGCHMSFSAHSVRPGVLRPIGEPARGFEAIRAGHTTVKSSHAMCDGPSPDPECIGGLAPLPAESVTVVQ